MKILFLIGAMSRVRNFDRAITLLAQQGHEVRLAGRPRGGTMKRPSYLKDRDISIVENPTERADAWRDHVELLRSARDYVRYLDPRFARATRLVKRAGEFAPTGLPRFCETHPWLKRFWRLLAGGLQLVEDLIPSDPSFEAFLKQERPDVVLVTPLVTFESYQTDYVKSAHKLGLPIAFLPFSWDNLTNKGLMRIHPDRVLVWNDTQAQEAVELHGIRPDQVVVTGAPRFDAFFELRAATGRAEYCRKVGLDPARPFVLYLGSSPLTGPNEVELVRRWAEGLRRSPDEALRTCGILIRPHPVCRDQWTAVDLSDLPAVAVSLDTRQGVDQELYDALHHAAAVVGLNTSALLEAGIVGKPALTLVIPGFDEGQIGTIHFHYLVHAHGGLVTVARTFDEHHRHLAEVLASGVARSERSRYFVHRFLRPRGLDAPVAPILVSEVERLAEIRKRPRPFAPLWHYPLRRALLAWLQRRQQPIDAQGTARRDLISTSLSLRPVSQALEDLRQSSGPILVGPWLDDVTHELLYWIPFLRWVVAEHQIVPERLVVISRGSVRAWYGALASRYLDARDLFAPTELHDALRRSVPQSKQNFKQSSIFPLDQEVLRRAGVALALPEYQVLHPMHMFRVLHRLITDRAVGEMGSLSHYERVAVPDHSELAGRLPDEYVAVGFPFGEAFPEGRRQREFIANVLARVSEDVDIVLLDQPSPLDGHPLPDGGPAGRIHRLGDLVTESHELDVQTRVLARARAFVGSYGDLAYLAAFCGLPSIAYYSEAVPEHQLQTARDLFGTNGWAPFRPIAIDEFEREQLVFRRGNCTEALTSPGHAKATLGP